MVCSSIPLDRIPVTKFERATVTAMTLAQQVNPPEGFTRPAAYGDVDPQLLQVGAIDESKFGRVYQASGRPLNKEQLDILHQKGQGPIVINQQNAYFMLNFFWALGLVNKNPILEKGHQTLELATYFKAVEGKDFKTRILVLGRIAFSKPLRSVGSTNVTSMPMRGKV